MKGEGRRRKLRGHPTGGGEHQKGDGAGPVLKEGERAGRQLRRFSS